MYLVALCVLHHQFLHRLVGDIPACNLCSACTGLRGALLNTCQMTSLVSQQRVCCLTVCRSQSMCVLLSDRLQNKSSRDLVWSGDWRQSVNRDVCSGVSYILLTGCLSGTMHHLKGKTKTSSLSMHAFSSITDIKRCQMYFTTSQSQLYVYCGLPVLVRVKKSRVILQMVSLS